ncbi:DUF2797 domain-containing protein [Streptomyces sp. ISL-36]|uniref:DUF2797 domain-containing protein n=1 Tax=Streptomyces sp. ISL-36 TaxID=2819182 RepID=UPI001BEC5EBF|nr:DUF2797 domain-containing protein [Streptomyces sp. ISL-36]MBT2444920.1 DUF2797 domain-containing protein [Streptomyces sp. ISL-36]
MGWRGGVPGLRWEGGRVSALGYGQMIGFRAVGGRRCPGARGNPCPVSADVPPRATGGQCPACARLDRAHSVAADTKADDPQPYRVYLAWFGPGMTKVGITAEARGDARLLEQGAVAFSWVGRGPLMAARRTEELLRHALKVPDRIPYAHKRGVRHDLPPPDERAREIEELYRSAVALPGWGDTLGTLPFEVRDHARAFGLDGLPALSGTVAELREDGVVAGRLLAAAGPDLHLLDSEGQCLVVDTRLVRGWGLVSADAGAAVTVPVRKEPGRPQDGLF